MSIVQPRLAGARVLDLFAGSGALGLEALSRGAASCTFVELTDPALRAIRENVATLGATDRVTIHRADALRFVQRLAGAEFDLAFADPPFHLGIAGKLAALWVARPFVPFLGVEHDVHESLLLPGRRRVYGGTAITLLENGVDDPANASYSAPEPRP